MTVTEADVYVAPIHVDEVFADPTYQRVLDVARARKMAAAWDRRLAGILEVSDRGEGVEPRYAIMDGQHRWAAARFLVDPPLLVANVHEELTVADEAALFDKLNRQRKQTNNWDHWKARSAAGDPQVTAIEAVLVKYGLRVSPGPVDGYVGCTGALEKVTKLGGTALLDQSLSLITGTWQRRRDGLDSPIIHGIALVLHHLKTEIDLERLADVLIDVLPRQLKTQAVALREMSPGTLPVITAIVIMGMYNKRPGRKVEVNHRTFGGTGIVNNARKEPAAARPKKPSAGQESPEHREPPRGVPDPIPHYADTDEHAQAVADMEGQSVADIAAALGISERTVRRIQADLGIAS